MKKMSMVCMTVVCLATPGFSSRVSTPIDGYLATPEHEIEKIQRELKDPKKMRECMIHLFSSCWHNLIGLEEATEFKRKFDVSDKDMEVALLDVVREWSPKGWPVWQGPDAPMDVRMGYIYLTGAIKLLAFCADAKGKKLLMGIFTDTAKDGEYRLLAIDSYMQRIAVRDAWETFASFITDDVLAIVDRYRLYHLAMRTYDRAKSDTQTRTAIIATMSAILAKETNELYLVETDKRFAERSTEYAESPQRKATLERMGKPPEKETK